MDQETSASSTPSLTSHYPEPPLPFGRIRIDALHPDFHTSTGAVIEPAPAPYSTNEEVLHSQHSNGLADSHASLRAVRAMGETVLPSNTSVTSSTASLPRLAENAAPVNISDCFRDEDREEFKRLLLDPKHINAMRIDAAKQRRIMHYLRTPGAPAQRGQSAKEKFEARKKWMLRDDDGENIYRQASSKFPDIRKLVIEEDAFDVIAREHLKLGHWGRNRLQKHIAERYYGVSREEIQWVIDRCMQCGPKRQKHNGVKQLAEEQQIPQHSPLHSPIQMIPSQAFTPGS